MNKTSTTSILITLLGACTLSSCIWQPIQQQFTREYKRLFGNPPMKDIRRNS